MKTLCIISGGQTGVDQGALEAAMRLGLATGGWCPPGRCCESGIIPPGSIVPDRGTQWTIECASDIKKPLLVADPFEKGSKEMIMGWLCSIPVSILNVAGPSEMACPGIFKTAHDLLVEVFQRLRQMNINSSEGFS